MPHALSKMWYEYRSGVTPTPSMLSNVVHVSSLYRQLRANADIKELSTMTFGVTL